MGTMHPTLVCLHASRLPGTCHSGDWTTQRRVELTNRLLPTALLAVVCVSVGSAGAARELSPPVASPQTRDRVVCVRLTQPTRPSGRAAPPIGVWSRNMKPGIQVLLLEGSWTCSKRPPPTPCRCTGPETLTAISAPDSARGRLILTVCNRSRGWWDLSACSCVWADGTEWRAPKEHWPAGPGSLQLST